MGIDYLSIQIKTDQAEKIAKELYQSECDSDELLSVLKLVFNEDFMDQ